MLALLQVLQTRQDKNITFQETKNKEMENKTVLTGTKEDANESVIFKESRN